MLNATQLAATLAVAAGLGPQDADELQSALGPLDVHGPAGQLVLLVERQRARAMLRANGAALGGRPDPIDREQLVQQLVGMHNASVLAHAEETQELRAALRDARAEAERHALSNDGCVPGAAYRDLSAEVARLREQANEVASAMPEEYDGDEAQEDLILRFVRSAGRDLTAALARAETAEGRERALREAADDFESVVDYAHQVYEETDTEPAECTDECPGCAGERLRALLDGEGRESAQPVEDCCDVVCRGRRTRGCVLENVETHGGAS